MAMLIRVVFCERLAQFQCEVQFAEMEQAKGPYFFRVVGMSGT